MDGAEIRARRRALGLTQAEFAQLLDVSRDYVGQIERGTAKVSVRTRLLVNTLAPAHASTIEPVTTDPLEQQIEGALIAAGIRYEADYRNAANLDFYLPDFDVYLEVKRFHSDRIAGQMARAPNVIAIQGLDSVRFIVRLLGNDGAAPVSPS